jgi:hypothetical protein
MMIALGTDGVEAGNEFGFGEGRVVGDGDDHNVISRPS